MTSNKNSVKNVLNFDHMLTPHIITFVYWLCVLGVGGVSIGMMAQGRVAEGVLTLVFGFLGIRIWCELMIVLFKINENIQKVADKS